MYCGLLSTYLPLSMYKSYKSGNITAKRKLSLRGIIMFARYVLYSYKLRLVTFFIGFIYSIMLELLDERVHYENVMKKELTTNESLGTSIKNRKS